MWSFKITIILCCFGAIMNQTMIWTNKNIKHGAHVNSTTPNVLLLLLETWLVLLLLLDCSWSSWCCCCCWFFLGGPPLVGCSCELWAPSSGLHLSESGSIQLSADVKVRRLYNSALNLNLNTNYVAAIFMHGHAHDLCKIIFLHCSIRISDIRVI